MPTPPKPPLSPSVAYRKAGLPPLKTPVQLIMELKTPAQLIMETVIRSLPFSPENVVEAASQNAVLFMKAADARVQCLHATNEAEMALKSVYSKQAIDMRNEAHALGEKLTEAGLEARLNLDPSVQAAQKRANRCEEEEEMAKLVVESLRQRRDMISSITYLVRDEVSLQRAAEQGQASLKQSRDELAKKFPGSTL